MEDDLVVPFCAANYLISLIPVRAEPYLYPLYVEPYLYPLHPAKLRQTSSPFLTGTSVTLQLINTFPTTPELALRKALTCDFPFFEPCCKLSPNTVCNHLLTPCRKASLSQIGYSHYNEETKSHEFVGLPEEPEPIFKLHCFGCGNTKGQCKEECSSYSIFEK